MQTFTVQSIQMKERAHTVVIDNPKIEACNCKNPIIEACKMQKPYNYNFSIRPTDQSKSNPYNKITKQDIIKAVRENPEIT